MSKIANGELNEKESLENLKNDINESEVSDSDIDIVERGGEGDDGIDLSNDKNKKEKSNKKSKKNSKKSDSEENKLTIEHFSIDLTKEAKNNKLDPVIGRDREISQVVYTLLRKSKNNPLLVGEAGVGKTAIVEGLAQKIVNGEVPEKLKNKRIMMIDMGTLVAGTKYRGDFEARFKAILDEASDPTNNIIMFIDEIHTIIGAGGAHGTDDASQLIKPKLARGKIKLIGATTFDEFQKHLEKDAALKRRFQEVVVNEPDVETATKIMNGLKVSYEDFHGVAIDDDSLLTAVKLSKRYILNKYLPDKAIDILDEACARKSTITKKLDNDKKYQGTLKKIKKLQVSIEKAIEIQDYYAAADLQKHMEDLKEELGGLRKMKNIPRNMRPVVSKEDIGNVLADKTGIPSDVVSESEVDKLRRLQNDLEKNILGQTEAVKAVVKTLQRNRLSVVERKKPISSFLFVGPSGVGKTYLAKLISKDYFGNENSLIRVDMSEYMEKYSVSKLIGSAPGYIGHESGGMLTEEVRRKPYSVILFDEIEKADKDVLNILLQILDEGHIKDAKGRIIDFKSTVIIMTSNIGNDEFSKKISTIGFSVGEDNKNIENKDFESKKEKVLERVKEFISPELLNRIDYKIVFKPLGKTLLEKIYDLKIKEFLNTWKNKSNIELPTFNKKKISKIIDKIYNPQYGVRPIEKHIHEEVEPEIIQKLMNG